VVLTPPGVRADRKPVGGDQRRASFSAAMMTIRVAIGEDNALLREGLSGLIAGREGFELVGVAASRPLLVDLIQSQRPDVVVTDIRMPPSGTDEGIQVAAWLRTHHPRIGVVILSQYANPAYAVALLEEGSGRRAYLLKERVAGAHALADAVRIVAGGGSFIDPLVVEEMVAARRALRTSDLSWLTPREVEILAEMATGKSNAAIAAALHVTERGVEKHIGSIFSKLGLTEERDVNRRVKAVLVYLRDGPGG
jgi:DNA-binding NarL/FixJ family response regulator